MSSKSFDANVTYEEENGKIMSMIINPFITPPSSNLALSQIITDLGLETGLELALDAGDSASAKDQYFSSNVLLLHCDGSDAATSFSDSATSKTVTANGNAQIDTAQSKFGGASALFDGTGDYLTITDDASLEFGSGDFTIELHVRFNALPGSGVAVSLFRKVAGSNFSYSLNLVNTAGTYTIQFLSSTTGVAATTTISNTWSTPTTGVWYHVAVARSGTTLRAFIDGTQIGTNQTNSETFFAGTGDVSIGGTTAGANPLDGWLDEIRITKGAARYTGAFTAPIVAHPNGKWFDTSGNGYDFFRGVGLVIGTDDPAFNGTTGGLSSAEYWSFDGGDFFTYDTTNETWMQNLHKDNAAFTLAFFIYVGSLAADQRVFATISNFGADTGFAVTITTAGLFQIEVRNAGVSVAVFNGAGVTAGAWHFIAWSVDEAAGASGALSVLNGVVVDTEASTYSSPSAGSATGTLHIGSSSTGAQTLSSGSRLGIGAAWSRALTATELGNLNASLRGRYL